MTAADYRDEQAALQPGTVFYSGDDPPCVGLPPDTDPCPLCGARLDEACRAVREPKHYVTEG